MQASDARANGAAPAAPLADGLNEDAMAPLLAALAASGAAAQSYGSLKEGLKALVRRDPFDATVVTVLGGAFLFYLAEKDRNPKIETYWDALVFISTCLSVGYADIFARTPAGQAIASAVMTIGPAISGAIFDPPADGGEAKPEAPPELLRIQEAIAGKLDAILQELRANRGG
jgi:hypothetical protein